MLDAINPHGLPEPADAEDLAAIHAQDQFNRSVTAAGPAHAIASGLRNAVGGSIGHRRSATPRMRPGTALATVSRPSVRGS